MANNTIYITGHRHPDTDSIVSSIAYSHLKRERNQEAVACRLGPLNLESKYVLDRFGFDEPMLLENAKVRLHEIDYEKALCVKEDMTIFDTLQLMQDQNKPFSAVVDDNQKLIGMITKNDLSKVGLGDTAFGIDLLKNTPLHNIAKTLNGTILYEADRPHYNGKVSIVALSERRAHYYEAKDRIVILGEDSEGQKELIKKGAALLILVWTDYIDESVYELAKEYNCSLMISGYGVMNTSRYLYFSPPISLLMSTNIDLFYEYEYMEDVTRKLQKKRHKAFPVVSRNHTLLGFLYKEHVINYPKKKIIMVDHNEFSQSVPDIRDAEVLEVVDHHRIYDFYSSKPISFRNEIVGSSATIITSMYKEYGVEIPEKMAGILLCAILSDTLNFQSPTTTSKDIELAEELEKIAKVDMEQLAYDMFFVGSDIENKTMKDFLREDVKNFEIGNYHMMIAQVIVPISSAIDSMKDQIQPYLDEYVHRYGYDLSVLVFTSVSENGSLLFYSGKLSNWVKENYPYEKEGYFLEGVLSRKKQIVPLFTDIISSNV